MYRLLILIVWPGFTSTAAYTALLLPALQQPAAATVSCSRLNPTTLRCAVRPQSHNNRDLSLMHLQCLGCSLPLPSYVVSVLASGSSSHIHVLAVHTRQHASRSVINRLGRCQNHRKHATKRAYGQTLPAISNLLCTQIHSSGGSHSQCCRRHPCLCSLRLPLPCPLCRPPHLKPYLGGGCRHIFCGVCQLVWVQRVMLARTRACITHIISRLFWQGFSHARQRHLCHSDPAVMALCSRHRADMHRLFSYCSSCRCCCHPSCLLQF